jgi:hypothetical protein
VMIDALAGRWLFFDGGRVVQTRTVADSIVRALGGASPNGVDTLGHILLVEGEVTADSANLVLFSWNTGTRRTVARLKSAPPSESTPPLLQVYEKAWLTRDGWIAIARMDPYRVDWRTPEGRWINGRALPVPSETLERGDRELIDPAGRSRNALWPTRLPPLPRGWTLLPSPDGRVLIRRMTSVRHPYPRYDVVNRQGELETQIRLDENEYILGFGNGTIYAVAQDALGLQYLRRHRWRR